MIDGDDCGAITGMNEWQGKLKYWEENYVIASKSITDTTLQDPGLNPVRRVGNLQTIKVKNDPCNRPWMTMRTMRTMCFLRYENHLYIRK
jgi:hypothetical protein